MNVHLHTLALGWLVKRVFAVEVLVCVHCAGKLHVVEIATEKAAIKRRSSGQGGRLKVGWLFANAGTRVAIFDRWIHRS